MARRGLFKISLISLYEIKTTRYVGGMKIMLLIAAMVALNSCNTCIGIGRDTKQAYQWTASKFQGSGSANSDPYGEPVY